MPSLPPLPHLDIILLLILLGFTLMGFWRGFIKTLGKVVAIVGGAIAASFLQEPVSVMAVARFGGGWITSIVVFLILYAIASRLLLFLFNILDHFFGFLKIIPFVGFINRLAGAGLGLLEGVVLLGSLALAAASFLPEPLFDQYLGSSEGVNYLLLFAHPFLGFLPEWMR